MGSSEIPDPEKYRWPGSSYREIESNHILHRCNFGRVMGSVAAWLSLNISPITGDGVSADSMLHSA